MNEIRVSSRHWLRIAGLVILTLILFSTWTGSSQSVEVDEVGFITKNTTLCYTDEITIEAIDSLEQWAAIIKRQKIVEGDPFRRAEYLSLWCSLLAEGYPVVLFKAVGGFALVGWEKSLGFTHYTFLIRLQDFQTR